MKTFCLVAITLTDALNESQQEMKKLFPTSDISRGKGRPNTGNGLIINVDKKLMNDF